MSTTKEAVMVSMQHTKEAVLVSRSVPQPTQENTMPLHDDTLSALDHETEALGLTESVKAKTIDIYTAIEALTSEQRTLAVEVFLRQATAILGRATDYTSMMGAIATVPGLLALAGYANAVHRETDLGATTTGDRAVDAVLGQYHSMLREHALSQMSPETKARLDAGEDPEVVAEEIRQRLIAETGKGLSEGPATAETRAEEGPSYGMYL